MKGALCDEYRLNWLLRCCIDLILVDLILSFE